MCYANATLCCPLRVTLTTGSRASALTLGVSWFSSSSVLQHVCFDNLPFLLVLLPCSFFPPFLLSRSSRHRRIPYNASVVVLQQVFPSCRVGGIRPHPSCTCSSTTTWVSKKMRRAMLQLLEHLAPPRTISWPSTSCLLQHPSRMAGCVFSKLFSSAHLFLCGTFSNRPLLLAF